MAGEETPVKVPTSPWNVVYQGVGLVTVKDVTIAQAAKGPILCYGVNVQANAARQCQVRVRMYNERSRKYSGNSGNRG